MGVRAPDPILVDQGKLPGGGNILPSPEELVTGSHVGSPGRKNIHKDLRNRLRNKDEEMSEQSVSCHSCLCISGMLGP